MAAAAAGAASTSVDVLIFLRHWMEDEFSSNPQGQGRIKESIIRKTTVAYGIVELLARCHADKQLTPLQNNEEKIIRLDNFAVCISRVKQGPQKSSSPQPPSSGDVKGVSMLSSGLSLSIEEPAYLSFLDDDEGGRDDKQLGKYLEVVLTSNGGGGGKKHVITYSDLLEAASEGGSDNNVTPSEEEEKSRRLCCYLIAKVLYELFTGEAFPENNKYKDEGDKGRTNKRVKTDLDDLTTMERMQSLGAPVSIGRMMQNLLDSALIPAHNDEEDGEHSGDVYKTPKEVGEDLHLLLFDPDRFLFDRDTDVTDCMPLLYKKDKLYGRDEEEKLITDTFCRVTRGKSEAFFIGGFSGSGKSMLVNTLRGKVKAVGGYVIKHKFDDISQDRPISGVVSAVDQLCAMILARHTPNRLAGLVQKIKDEFGADIGLLARMLPSISLLSPDFIMPRSISVSPDLTHQIVDEPAVDTMNARSVCFTLLRFVRIISSPNRPIMVSHYIFKQLILLHVRFYLGRSEQTLTISSYYIVFPPLDCSCSWTTCSGQMTLPSTSFTSSSLTRWAAACFLWVPTEIMKLILTTLFLTSWGNLRSAMCQRPKYP